MPLKICAVIPAYNEEENIAEVVKKTREHVDSVIVVDDGSLDDTAHIAEMVGATVLRHEVNKGYGVAIRSCFDAARRFDADVTVILDGDGQHDPRYIPDLIGQVQDNGTDIVVGSRFLGISNNIPPYRRFGINVLNRVTWLFSKKNIDSQSGFRAYSRKAINLLNPIEKGMGVSSEILIKAKENGLKVKEVPVNIRYDVGKPSKNPIDHGVSVIISVIKLMSQKRPLMFFGVSGLASFTTGLFFGWQVMDTVNNSYAMPVGTALLTTILLIVGVFLMGIGMTIYALQGTIRREIAESEHEKKVVESALKKSGGYIPHENRSNV